MKLHALTNNSRSIPPGDFIRWFEMNGFLTNATWNLLDMAFKHGAYIAGGFANKVATVLNCGKYRGDFDEDTMRELVLYTNYDLKHPYAYKVRSGDIDVWFRTKEGLDAFLLELNGNFENPMKDRTPMTSGFGIEVKCWKHPDPAPEPRKNFHGQVVQIMTAVWGEPEEIMEKFDIYNAAVCITKDCQVLVPEGWEDLNTKGILHLQHFNEKYTFQRITKWAQKHGYVGGFTPGAIEILKEAQPKLIEDILNSKIPRYKPGVTWNMPDFLKRWTMPIRSLLPIEIILNFVPVGGQKDNYKEYFNPFIKELIYRSTKEVQ